MEEVEFLLRLVCAYQLIRLSVSVSQFECAMGDSLIVPAREIEPAFATLNNLEATGCFKTAAL